MKVNRRVYSKCTLVWFGVVRRILVFLSLKLSVSPRIETRLIESNTTSTGKEMGRYRKISD